MSFDRSEMSEEALQWNLASMCMCSACKEAELANYEWSMDPCRILHLRAVQICESRQ